MKFEDMKNTIIGWLDRFVGSGTTCVAAKEQAEIELQDKTIQQFVYELIEENKLLKRNCNIGYENLEFYRNECERLKRKINKVIEVMDEILIFDDVTGTTVAIGNTKEEIQFYLSDCETIEEFRKTFNLKESGE